MQVFVKENITQIICEKLNIFKDSFAIVSFFLSK